MTNQVWDNKCKIDLDKREIKITNAFDWNDDDLFSTQITILLVNMTNPKDNRPAPGFTLETYLDTDMLYLQDQVQNVMTPILTCNYPCAACTVYDRGNCTACWQHDELFNPTYFMQSLNGDYGRCEK